MTTLGKTLQRVVTVGGTEIIVKIVPALDGVPAHVSFREKGKHAAHFTTYVTTAPAKAGS